MSNLGPFLLGVAAIITAVGGIVLGLRKRPADPVDPPPVDAYREVEQRIRVLHETIADLEEQIRTCRDDRRSLERLLKESRAERGRLLEKLARLGEGP